MGFFNRVILMGTVSRPVALRWVRDNLAVADLGVRVDASFRDRDGNLVPREFSIDVVAFGDVAQRAVGRVREGGEVLIHGRLKFDESRDPEGVRKSRYSIVSDRLEPITEAASVELTEAVTQDAPAEPAPTTPQPPPPATSPGEPERPKRRRGKPAEKSEAGAETMMLAAVG